MANQSFELIEFPVSRTHKMQKISDDFFAGQARGNGDLLRYMIGSEELENEAPRVSVRIYVINPQGTPAIRIQM